MHGSGPRANRPHQTRKFTSSWRRHILEYSHNIEVKFVDGEATHAEVNDAKRRATRADRLTGRLDN